MHRKATALGLTQLRVILILWGPLGAHEAPLGGATSPIMGGGTRGAAAQIAVLYGMTFDFFFLGDAAHGTYPGVAGKGR